MRAKLASVCAAMAMLPVAPAAAAEPTVAADPPVFLYQGQGDGMFVVVMCVVRSSPLAVNTNSECDVGGYGHSWLPNEDAELVNVSYVTVYGSYSVSFWIGGVTSPQVACGTGWALFNTESTPTTVTAARSCKTISAT